MSNTLELIKKWFGHWKSNLCGVRRDEDGSPIAFANPTSRLDSECQPEQVPGGEDAAGPPPPAGSQLNPDPCQTDFIGLYI